MSASYKDTLLLPKSDFPMKPDLAKWEAAGLDQQTLDARAAAPLFVLQGARYSSGTSGGRSGEKRMCTLRSCASSSSSWRDLAGQ